ncbi:MAG TPA: S-adenosylmethionine:tRNA ribosyltransferase-isomerase, partial [Flavisolibacter sp.]
MKTDPKNILIRDFDYDLPQEKIADFPLASRDQSKLLVYRDGQITDDHFYNLSQNIPEGSTLVVNDTRVIEARILFQKPTGGIIEIFCLEANGQPVERSLAQTGKVQWQCLIGGASKWKPGQLLHKKLMIAGREIILTGKYISREPEHFIIEFSWEPPDLPFADIIHAAGAIPLPPYIKREVTEMDSERYQTIFSRQEGSVAAPTSALHFTQAVFDSLAKKNIAVERITLHVGAGTFKPVKTDTIADHSMHREPFSVKMEALKKIIACESLIAVGTTSLRTLESLHWIAIKLMKGLIKEDWELHQWEAYDLDAQFPGINSHESLQFLLHWMKENNVEEIHCYT